MTDGTQGRAATGSRKGTTATRTRITRRGLLGGLAAALAAPQVMAAPPARSLRPRPRAPMLGQVTAPDGAELVARARLDARIGYSVADAASGTMLEGRDSRVPLPPASVAKALTTLYALDRLGADHRFATRLVATGPVQDGVIKGDLVLAGSGDPTLDTDGLAQLAADLKAAGIRSVEGAFRTWAGALPYVDTIDVEQPAHVGYSPAVSGLNLNFNRVHFEWRREGSNYAVTMDARTGRFRPDVATARMAIVDRSGPVYTYADRGGIDDWTVARGALGKGGARWLPVRRPDAYAAEVFATLARSHGIVLKPAEPARAAPSGTTLAEWRSGPLTGMLRDMLLHSTNITAECLGMAASRAGDPQIDSLVGSAAAMNAWLSTRYGVEGVALVDHSGLGGASRVTTEAMVRVLADPRSRAALRPLLKGFLLRDSQGRPDRGSPIDVVAKTGTLNFVSGLAGYARAADGTDLVFAIFAADVPRREALSEAQRERPPGARGWNGRAKMLQSALIERWGTLYGTS